MKKEKSFNNWRHNAIHLTFPNGNSLSTVWGYGSYSDNYNSGDLGDYPKNNPFEKFMDSDTCEIMILNAPDKLTKRIHKKFNFDGSVLGQVTMSQWLEIVKMLSKPDDSSL